MNEYANKIQAVMDTLQHLDMLPTYDNCNHMLGCLQVLSEVKDAISNGAIYQEDGKEYEEVIIPATVETVGDGKEEE